MGCTDERNQFQCLNIQSWTNVLGHFCISGGISNSYRSMQPIPSPYKQCWTRVSRFFSKFQLCVGWAEGELHENFKKDVLFYEGTQTDKKYEYCILLSQGLLSMIVVSKTKLDHCYWNSITAKNVLFTSKAGTCTLQRKLTFSCISSNFSLENDSSPSDFFSRLLVSSSWKSAVSCLIN